MKGIVPLYYDMKKALPSQINNTTIYNGLISAFTGGNIGIYSNSISKIWNNDVFIYGSEEEKQNAIDCVKRLCCQNNYVIDYAKTLYKPEFPEYIKKEIAKYTKDNLPHFFRYAKDKSSNQVTEKNNSFVNRIGNIAKIKRLDYSKLNVGTINFELLMKKPNIKVKVSYYMKNKRAYINEDNTDKLIVEYEKIMKKTYVNFSYLLSVFSWQHCGNIFEHSSTQLQYKKYGEYVKDVKNKLSKWEKDEQRIVDKLVKYLYRVGSQKGKRLLWLVYGDILFQNLLNNVEPNYKYVQCVDCNDWFFAKSKASKTCRCYHCQLKKDNDIKNLYKKKKANQQTLVR